MTRDEHLAWCKRRALEHGEFECEGDLLMNKIPTVRSIYVIGASNGPFKLGIAFLPERRRRKRQIGAHEQLLIHYVLAAEISDARMIERYAHRLLRKQRVKGEWFFVSVLTAIGASNRAAESWAEDLEQKFGVIVTNRPGRSPSVIITPPARAAG